MPKVLIQGSYRAPDKERAFRLVHDGDRLILESEIDKDAMGDIMWSRHDKISAGLSAEQAVLKELAKKAGLIKGS